MNCLRNLTYALFICICTPVLSQQSIQFEKVTEYIKIDGVLDSTWLQFEQLSNFQKSAPLDTGLAISQTEVRICFDDKFFYLFATCHESSRGKKQVVQSLKRDFSYPRSDAFVVFIDPYSDGVNGFSFSCNPYGAQREGVLESGGVSGVTTSWDNKWYSATTKTDSLWTVEMAIPFKSIRFNENNRSWKINFSRNDQKINETSTWVHVPRNFNVGNLAFTAPLNWAENPPSKGKNISLIPYITTVYIENKTSLNAGGDAKIALSSALNLDLTINPDFSTVEVDQQVTNLDRFEIFFPERRQFFIENSDLFSSLGNANTRPFFSRRIGVGVNSTGKSVQNPIYGGARISGKINDNWRLGVMTIQTSNGKNKDLNPENFSIAAIQRKLFKRSTIGGFYLDKEVFDPKRIYLRQNYVRIAGTEFNFNSHDSKWVSKSYLHSSLDSNTKAGVNQGFYLNYSTKFFSFTINQELVSKSFNSSTGFVRRKDYIYFKPSIEYLIYPKKSKFIYHDFGGGFQPYANLNWIPNDVSTYVFYKNQLKNTAAMQLTFANNYIVLQRNFDPSAAGGTKLLAGTVHKFNTISYLFTSNERKSLFLNLNSSVGQYYNGHKYSFSGSLRYRLVPNFVCTFNYSYDKIVLPLPYKSVNWTLLGPQFEFLFSTKLFWTTYIQYNQQLDNININSRLQWRFKPASDLFIVYTNNFLPETLANKSSGIVVKFTYWFNI